MFLVFRELFEHGIQQSLEWHPVSSGFETSSKHFLSGTLESLLGWHPQRELELLLSHHSLRAKLSCSSTIFSKLLFDHCESSPKDLPVSQEIEIFAFQICFRSLISLCRQTQIALPTLLLVAFFRLVLSQEDPQFPFRLFFFFHRKTCRAFCSSTCNLQILRSSNSGQHWISFFDNNLLMISPLLRTAAIRKHTHHSLQYAVKEYIKSQSSGFSCFDPVYEYWGLLSPGVTQRLFHILKAWAPAASQILRSRLKKEDGQEEDRCRWYPF